MAPAALLTGHIPSINTTSDAWVQRSPGSPDEPILGGASGSTSETIVLYHYGNLEGRVSFKSPPGYPRLTDCDIATTQAEAAKYTGTPINDNLQYKYELRIDRAYFEEHFINSGTRGAYSEFVTKQPIPIKYFRNVLKLTPAPMEPPAKTATGAIPEPGSGTPGPTGTPGSMFEPDVNIKGGTPTTPSGSTKTATPPAAEIPGPTGTPGRMSEPNINIRGGRSTNIGGSTRGAVGPYVGAFVMFAIQIGLHFLEKWDMERMAKNKIEEQLEEKIKPKIVDKINGLDRTKLEKGVTTFANVTIEIHLIEKYIRSGLHSGSYIDPEVRLADVSITRKNITSEQTRDSEGEYDYKIFQYTYSFPVGIPSAEVLPSIAILHNLLAHARTDLQSVHVGMAGELVALDYLNVALQATDMTGHSAFENNTPEERYQLTIDAMDHSLSVLEGLDKHNPALKNVVNLVGSIKFLVDLGLAYRWPIMV